MNKPTQLQMFYKSVQKTAEYNKDLEFLRKTTAKHYVDCSIHFAEAWNREKEYNKRIKNKTSIIFPNIDCFRSHYDYAMKHPLE